MISANSSSVSRAADRERRATSARPRRPDRSQELLGELGVASDRPIEDRRCGRRRHASSGFGFVIAREVRVRGRVPSSCSTA